MQLSIESKNYMVPIKFSNSECALLKDLLKQIAIPVILVPRLSFVLGRTAHIAFPQVPDLATVISSIIINYARDPLNLAPPVCRCPYVCRDESTATTHASCMSRACALIVRAMSDARDRGWLRRRMGGTSLTRCRPTA